MKKILILIVSIIAVFSTVPTHAQSEIWTVEGLEKYVSNKQWGPNGNGYLWLGSYRSLTYSSYDDENIDAIFLTKTWKKMKDAKDDFTEILFYLRQGENDEWRESETEYYIYLESCIVKLERKKKTVCVELMQYMGDE